MISLTKKMESFLFLSYLKKTVIIIIHVKFCDKCGWVVCARTSYNIGVRDASLFSEYRGIHWSVNFNISSSVHMIAGN